MTIDFATLIYAYLQRSPEKMKAILTALLILFIFFTGWFVRGSQNEAKAIEAIQESIQEASSDLLNVVSEQTVERQKSNEEKRKIASGQLGLLLLGRTLAAQEFLNVENIESLSEKAQDIIDGFKEDYEAGVDYCEFQSLADKLHKEIIEIQSTQTTR